MMSTRFTLAAAALLISAAGANVDRRPAPVVEHIAGNDNRLNAGMLTKGVLTVKLDARTGGWQPDGPSGPTIITAAFGEVGKSLETPGPLLRAPVGAEVHASIHNALTKPMWVYGLGAVRGLSDSSRIAPGETHDFRFRLTASGTYFYVARTDTVPVIERSAEDSQLGGIIVVDPPNAKPIADERIFAITNWFTVDPASVSGLGPNSTITFNGLTYPVNGRIEMTMGDSAHWRFVNLSQLDHPLHLHGFYFSVNAKGDGVRDTVYGPADRRGAVTEYLLPMQTTSIAWSPDRSGNWIFHCHFAGHMSPREALDADRSAMVMPDMHMVRQAGAPKDAMPKDAMMKHMSNLVIGIHVAAKGPAPVHGAATRNIRLLMRSRANVYSGKYVGYSFVLGGSPEAQNREIMRAPGPVLELVRGERVAVTMVNQTHEPTAVHWHGIEIESYSDGVPDISGEPGNVLPHIAPGDSITVQYTPPRAGTFMYHSHSNEFQQISSGLYGALIVRERGEVRDPNERILLFSDNGPLIYLIDPSKFPQIQLNGAVEPAPIEVNAGRPIKLRVIGIRSDLATDITLMDGDKPAAWRIVAKDGMTMPAHQVVTRPAHLILGAGETYDIQVTPRRDASLVLKYNLAGAPPGAMPVTSVPIRIK